jgi:hypothetical protein
MEVVAICPGQGFSILDGISAARIEFRYEG